MARFRTIEISDPGFESDNLRFITVKSEHLKGRGDICVFVPPTTPANTPLPVVILLHGVYGSAWGWSKSGGVHLEALKMINDGTIPPMVIAMPSDGLWGDGSGYLMHNGYDFEKWVVEDVVAALKEKITGVDERSSLFIGGLSMGGFGSMRIGTKYGARFKGVSGHSSITNLEQLKQFVEEDISNYHQPVKTDEDVFQTIQHYSENLPPLRFDCGIDDPLIEYNRRLHQELSEAGITHIYEEFPGGHEWPYWQAHVGKTLRFFAQQLIVPA